MINIYKVLLKESPLDSPFAHKEKCDDMLSAAASLSSSLGELNNAISNNKNNQTLMELNDENLMFQREQNDLNRAENRYLTKVDQDFARQQMMAQQAFNLEMWNKNNDYNSPLHQVQRLKAAGINPSSLVGNGNSSSPVSAVSANGVQSKNYQGVAPQNTFAPTAYTGFHPENAVNAFNQSQLASASAREMQSRAHNIDLGSDLLDKSMVYQVRQWQNLVDKGGIEGELARKSLQFVNATMNYDIKLRYGQTLEQDVALDNMREELRGLKIQNDINNIIKAYQPSISDAQLKQVQAVTQQCYANIGLINSNKLLTDEERENRIKERVGIVIDNGLKALDFQTRRALKDEFIEQGKYQTEQAKWSAVDMFMHSGRGFGSTDRPIWQSFIDTADKFDGYTRKFGKNRIVGRM